MEVDPDKIEDWEYVEGVDMPNAPEILRDRIDGANGRGVLTLHLTDAALVVTDMGKVEDGTA